MRGGQFFTAEETEVQFGGPSEAASKLLDEKLGPPQGGGLPPRVRYGVDENVLPGGEHAFYLPPGARHALLLLPKNDFLLAQVHADGGIQILNKGKRLGGGAYGDVSELKVNEEEKGDAKRAVSSAQALQDESLVIKTQPHTSLDTVRQTEYEAEVIAEIDGSCGFTVSFTKENIISSMWMKKINGTPLDKYKYKNEEDLLDVLIAVIKATLQFHEKYNFVHGDIKASNMFLIVQSDGSYVVKFCDYGFTRRRGMLTNGEWAAPTEDEEGSWYLPPETAQSIPAEFSIDYFSVGQFVNYAFRYDPIISKIDMGSPFFNRMNHIFLLLVQANAVLDQDKKVDMLDRYWLKKPITPRMMNSANVLPGNRDIYRALAECEELKAKLSKVLRGGSALSSLLFSPTEIPFVSMPPLPPSLVDQVKEKHTSSAARLEFLQKQLSDSSLSREIKTIHELVAFLNDFHPDERDKVITMFASDQEQLDRLAQSYHVLTILKNVKQDRRLVFLLRMNKEKVSAVLSNPIMFFELLQVFQGKHEILLDYLGDEVFKKILSNSNVDDLYRLFENMELALFNLLISRKFDDLKKLIKDGGELISFLSRFEAKQKQSESFLDCFTTQLIQGMTIEQSVRAIKDFLKFRFDKLMGNERLCYRVMLRCVAKVHQNKGSQEDDKAVSQKARSWLDVLFKPAVVKANPAAITAFVDALQNSSDITVQNPKALGDFAIIFREVMMTLRPPSKPQYGK